MECERESLSAEDSSRVVRTLALLCLVVLLAGLARKLEGDWLDLQVLNILRVRDALPLFLFCPAAILLSWRIFRLYKGQERRWLAGILLFGYYLLGVGYGMHESCNVMSLRYGPFLPKAPAESLRYFDDDLGHWIFFAGFAVTCLVGVYAETRAGGLSSNILGIPSALLGLVVAGVFVHNMRGESVTMDLLVAASVAIATLGFQVIWRRTSFLRTPCSLMILIGFGGGVAAVLLLNVLRPFQ